MVLDKWGQHFSASLHMCYGQKVGLPKHFRGWYSIHSYRMLYIHYVWVHIVGWTTVNHKTHFLNHSTYVFKTPDDIEFLMISEILMGY